MEKVHRVTFVKRRGITLLEVAVATGLLALLLSASGELLRVLSSKQRAAERRVVAMFGVQAIAEQIGNMRTEPLTAEVAQQVAIPAAIAAQLPGARLAVAIAEEQEPAGAKRATIELSWNDPAGAPTGPVRLTIWIFPDQVTAPQDNERPDD